MHNLGVIMGTRVFMRPVFKSPGVTWLMRGVVRLTDQGWHFVKRSAWSE